MNNIADFIPALILASGGIAIIAAASLMWFEHVAERLSDRSLRKPLQPAPRPALIVLQAPAQAVQANAGNIQAAA
jgi:hypothetical protein